MESSSWFVGRREYFVRQVLHEYFSLTCRFHELYATFLECDLVGTALDDRPCSRQAGRARESFLGQISAMVGSERHNGPLWRLKDLCHRVWPQEQREQHRYGALVDWLIGSLFHEGMKLKENLYLLNNYGPSAAVIGTLNMGTRHEQRPPPAVVRMVDIPAILRRIGGDITRQVNRMAFLFGQTTCLFRVMLPEFFENLLVMRLLAEEEAMVANLWGESLEELFNDLFPGRPALGFCMVGASYLRGQWYGQSLAMYRRALFSNGDCDEAIARIAQLEAILRETTESSAAHPGVRHP